MKRSSNIGNDRPLRGEHPISIALSDGMLPTTEIIAQPHEEMIRAILARSEGIIPTH